jgi:PTS system galactitol-specific IIB component
MKKKCKILILCATSVATSTAIAYRLEEVFEKEGLNVEIVQGTGSDYIPRSENLHNEFDLVIPTIEFPKNCKIPVINGVPFITGIGEDEAIQAILSILKKIIIKEGE